MTDSENREAVDVAYNKMLRERSGNVNYDDPLTSLLYSLLRDHVTPGVLENLVREIEDTPSATSLYTNGWLAQYANDLVRRIRHCEVDHGCNPI